MPRSTNPVTRRQAGALLLALSAAVLSACGGGGEDDTAPVGGGPTATPTAYAAGPITGFGSIIVNGIRYDDSAATISDDDDGAHGRERLKLGMMVEIDGNGVDRVRALGVALRIRFGSEIVGPVEAVNVAANSMTMLGQEVLVTDTTVFDDDLTGGLAGLSAGDIVEVHAQFDAATGRYTATRIDDEDDADVYKLRGRVANLDTSAKTFSIGGAVINYAGVSAASLPNLLANGQRVRVRLQTTQVNGQWVAVTLRHGVRAVEDRPDAHLRGLITAFTSATDFEVNGLKVDATNAGFPDGTAGLALGAMVEVKGAVSGGVLLASSVELDDRHREQRHRFELHGQISELDTTAKTFMLRNIKVSYAGEVRYDDGSEATLANGVKVEVKGRASADRTMLVATEIEFED
jgi:Domain of unknown function (DUF5666)